MLILTRRPGTGGYENLASRVKKGKCMRVKLTPYEVDPTDPFVNDVLGRQESAEILTQLVDSLDEPFVLAIDAGWGRGKTTFLEQWSAMLRNKGFRTLKFNAWENDFASDPLISFIGEMRSGLTENASQITNQEALAKKLEQAKTIGGKILKRSLPVAAKIVTVGLLDAEDFTEAAMADAVSRIVEDQIENYAADKNTLVEFRSNIEDFVRLAAGEGDMDGKPLVFFIDELDRCRPTYTVELLERLKHLFNVHGIVFVLAIDKEQIGHSICSMYGTGFDATGYLRRFIDLDYSLPNPSGEVFAGFLMGAYGFNDYFGTTPKHRISAKNFLQAFSYFAMMFNLGLRDQEQAFSKLSMIFRTSAPHENLFIPALLFLLILKHVKPVDYMRIVHQEALPQEIIELVPGSSAGRDFKSSIYGHHWLAYMKWGNISEDQLLTVQDDLRQKLTKNQESKELNNHERAIIEMITSEKAPLIPYLINKIEISDRFTS